jgi:hypothetical protein
MSLPSNKVAALKRCMQALEAEIALIESGKADHLLHLYGSYAVPEEFSDACTGRLIWNTPTLPCCAYPNHTNMADL